VQSPVELSPKRVVLSVSELTESTAQLEQPRGELVPSLEVDPVEGTVSLPLRDARAPERAAFLGADPVVPERLLDPAEPRTVVSGHTPNRRRGDSTSPPHPTASRYGRVLSGPCSAGRSGT